MPKSSLQITRGAKSRDKTVALGGLTEVEDAAPQLLDRVKRQLSEAVND